MSRQRRTPTQPIFEPLSHWDAVCFAEETVAVFSRQKPQTQGTVPGHLTPVLQHIEFY